MTTDEVPDSYGERRSGAETDIEYRVRDDGKMVALFEPGEPSAAIYLRSEDVSKILDDVDH